ncbi:MAG: nodulation protein NfeD [Nitrospirae bacterium YQR-1]
MSKTIKHLSLCVILLFLAVSGLNGQDKGTVRMLKANGAVGPVMSEFIIGAIEKSNDANDTALIIELDTPGGLDTSMRAIIKEMNRSKVPIVVYVSPSGARAASAGTFITMAAHVAAMAPGTNIGAAHPVSMHGELDDTMSEKITNDFVAYIKSISDSRKRNAKWAEEAVRKSVSITNAEALKLNVIDLVAHNRDNLLKQLNGRTVTIDNKTVTLHTSDVKITNEEMGTRLTVLGIITDPNVAYILMMLGIWGLFFELTNPGTFFPGIIGAISLILAFYSFQTLPVNYAGVLLIVLSLVLFILELKFVSHGALTIGGIISMTIGSVMLFQNASEYYKLSLYLIAVTVLMTAGFFSIIIGLAYKAYKRKPITGIDGLIGSKAIAKTAIGKEGMVSVRGELWSACSDTLIEKGDDVEVTEVSGLKLKVRKISETL